MAVHVNSTTKITQVLMIQNNIPEYSRTVLSRRYAKWVAMLDGLQARQQVMSCCCASELPHSGGANLKQGWSQSTLHTSCPSVRCAHRTAHCVHLSHFSTSQLRAAASHGGDGSHMWLDFSKAVRRVSHRLMLVTVFLQKCFVTGADGSVLFVVVECCLKALKEHKLYGWHERQLLIDLSLLHAGLLKDVLCSAIRS